MITIPKQLYNHRFIRVDNEKRPIEFGWTEDKNYDLKDISTFKDDSYGVLCGYNNLIVVDVDKQFVYDKLKNIEPFCSTFTVLTANKQLPHYYFYSDVTNTKTIRFDIPKFDPIKNKEVPDRIIDLQSKGTQVIGPGSKLTNGKSYNIVNNSDIKIVNVEKLVAQLQELFPETIHMQENYKSSEQDFNDLLQTDSICKEIKQKMTIEKLLKRFNIDTSINPCECPLGHESASKRNLSFDNKKGIWRCFHCNKSGDVIHLYEYLYNCGFVTAKLKLATELGIIDTLQQTLLKLNSDPDVRNKKEKTINIMVQSFLDYNRVFTIRSDKEHPEMWIYHDGIYIPEARTYIYEFCFDILKEHYSRNIATKVIEKIIAQTFIEQHEFFINEDVNLIPVKNGLLNIKTNQIEKFSDKYKFFYKIPVIYDPAADCPNIKQFIKDIVETQCDIDTLQELFGYILYREYKIEKAVMMIGEGSNGKSKLIELMHNFLGSNNCSNVSLEEMKEGSFSIVGIHNKLINVASDLDIQTIDGSGMFKKLTGRDIIKANRKFLDSVDFVNFAKLIFATNNLPKNIDNSVGYYRRWIPIKFPFHFIIEQKCMTPKDKKADLDIISKITSASELSGLLNWALIGLQRLLKNKKYSGEISEKGVQEFWNRASSSTFCFLHDSITLTEDSNDFIPLEELNDLYSSYCHKNSKKMDDARTFGEELRTFGAVKKQKRFNTQIKYVWCRIKSNSGETYQEDLCIPYENDVNFTKI